MQRNGGPTRFRRTWRRRVRRARLVAIVAIAVAAIPPAGMGLDSRPARAQTDEAEIAEIVAANWTAPPPIDIHHSAAGPHGSVTVIGDSVLHGSGRYGPTLVDRLVEHGWGPIRFRSGAGYSTGYFGRSPELTTTYWIQRFRAVGWDADNVIVNIGANDVEFCKASVACSREAIMHVVDEIGPGRRIWWPMITKFYTHTPQAVAWNTALAEVAAARDDFFTWDWPTELATGGYESADNTHLLPTSYPKRSLRMAEEFTAALARARRVEGGEVNLGGPTGDPATLVPTERVRLLDTRDDPGGQPRAGSSLRLELGEHVPIGTSAVVLYVSTARATGPGYLTVTPCLAPGETSTLTFDAGSARGASTIVAVDDTGVDDGDSGDDVAGVDGGRSAVCVDVGGPAATSTDVVVDIEAALVEGNDGLLLHPLPAPERLADTRDSTPTRRLTLPMPALTDAAAVNITAVNARDVGFVSAHRCDRPPPTTANLNYRPGPAQSSSAIVETGPSGDLCLTTSSPVDLVVDLTGTFRPAPADGADDGGLAFVATHPVRALDTRVGTGGWAPRLGRGQTIDVDVAPPWARAVTGAITMVRPRRAGFLQAAGCGGDPEVSSANAAAGGVVANSLTVGVDGDGRLCVTSSTVTHTIFDVTGWWRTPG